MNVDSTVAVIGLIATSFVDPEDGRTVLYVPSLDYLSNFIPDAQKWADAWASYRCFPM